MANSKKYVGQSKHAYNRIRDHLSALRGNHHFNKHLQSAWNKYSEKSFHWFVLEAVDLPMLDEREKFWIELVGSHNPSKGYNKEVGGNANKSPTAETRAKISSKLKGKKLSMDTRIKMSVARTGRVHSKEHCSKISASNKGRMHSHRALELCWAATRGRKASPEECARRSAAQMGRVCSMETRAKIAAAHLGRKNGPPSLDQRQKQSASMRQYWVNKHQKRGQNHE